MAPQPEQLSVTVTEVDKWPIDGMEGKEGRILTVKYPPSVHAPPHRHPGWQFIYVLEGKIVHQMQENRRENTDRARPGMKRVITCTCTSATRARMPGQKS